MKKKPAEGQIEYSISHLPYKIQQSKHGSTNYFVAQLC